MFHDITEDMQKDTATPALLGSFKLDWFQGVNLKERLCDNHLFHIFQSIVQ